MKKSLAKLDFKPVVGHEDKFKIPTGPIWYSCTLDCQPNDWSIRVKFTEKLSPDNAVMAEIDFLMEEASYLLLPGAQFKMFGSINFECFVEVIKEI